MTSTTRRYGALVDYHTGDVLRDATLAELAECILASRSDGGAGVIRLPLDHGMAGVRVSTPYEDGPETEEGRAVEAVTLGDGAAGVLVAWDGGTRTPCALADLTVDDARRHADCYVQGAELSHDAAERIAVELGVDLAHDCDEAARECRCQHVDDMPLGGHASGDSTCATRSAHSACSHDLRRLMEASA